MRAETQCLVVCIFFIDRVKSVVMIVDWTFLERRYDFMAIGWQSRDNDLMGT